MEPLPAKANAAGGLSAIGMPALVEAAMRGDHSAVTALLLDPNLPVNTADSETMTALHWAAAYNEPAIVRLLLSDQRVDPNARNKREGTPLHQAALGNALEAINALIGDARVVVNAQWGEAPLALAAAAGNALAVHALLHAGADSSIKDNWGKTAAEIAEDHGETQIASMIRSHSPASPAAVPTPKTGPAIVAASPPGPSTRILSKLMEAPLNEELALSWLSDPLINVAGFDFYKWSAMHKCCAWDKPTLLAALLKHPRIETPSPRGLQGDTPLHLAAEGGALRCVLLLAEDHRLLIDEQNDMGHTPLMNAAAADRVEVIRVLLTKGARVSVSRPDGRMAWHLARESGHSQAAEILYQAMTEVTRHIAEEVDLRLKARAAAGSGPDQPRPRPRPPAKKLNPALVQVQRSKPPPPALPPLPPKAEPRDKP